MSVIYCNKCDKYIDTDYSDHFDEHEEEEKDEQNN